MTTISKETELLDDEFEEEDYDPYLEGLLEQEREMDAYYSHAEAIHDAMHDEGLCA